MTIDIHSSKFPIREKRLGAITGYEGTAGDLCRHTRKRTLTEQERSFTQCTHCSSFPANFQLAMIQDAAVVNHAPLGCTGDFSFFNFCNRAGQTARGWDVVNARIINTNMRENEMVFGGAEKLQKAVREAYRRFQPKAIFVTTSCASAIIGENLEGILEEIETELEIPIVPIQCEGFRSKIWATGSDAAYHGILHKIVKPAKEKRSNLVNVININGVSGEGILTELLNKIGLEPNFVILFTSIAQLESLSEAAASVHICTTLGTYLAAGLEQHYGVPEVKAPPPYGIAGTDAWLRALGQTVGKEKEVEELISSEKERIAPELNELRGKLKGTRAFVSAGGVYGQGLISILREFDVEVIRGSFWHHDVQLDNGDAETCGLEHVVKHYGDIRLDVCNKQSFELVNHLNRLKPDLFIARHNGMAVLGAKLGIPTFFMADEHFGIAYQGLLNFGQELVNTISNPVFVRNLARHTKLPYTDWWLAQEPVTFWGGNIDE